MLSFWYFPKYTSYCTEWHISSSCVTEATWQGHSSACETGLEWDWSHWSHLFYDSLSADSLILGLSSVPILSQSYRFSSVQNSLPDIQVQFSSLMDIFQFTILHEWQPFWIDSVKYGQISSVLALSMTQRYSFINILQQVVQFIHQFFLLCAEFSSAHSWPTLSSVQLRFASAAMRICSGFLEKWWTELESIQFMGINSKGLVICDKVKSMYCNLPFHRSLMYNRIKRLTQVTLSLMRNKKWSVTIVKMLFETW